MMYEPTTLNCGGTLLDLTSPVVMSILNVTPDSFFAASRVSDDRTLLQQAERHLTEGAKILDIGGMSSRPKAEIIDESEELRRVLPAISTIFTHFPEAIISVDTIRSSVARAAVDVGARIVNDISAGNFDAKMFSTVAQLRVPYVLMHMKGTPATMQNAPVYDDVTLEILDFFIEKVGILRGLGVSDILLDVGFGFGKTTEHNFDLLKKMAIFRILECPILVGLSRKGMIYRTLETTADAALNGTTAANMLALVGGAKVLRVHDVRAAVETIRIFEAYSKT